LNNPIFHSYFLDSNGRIPINQIEVLRKITHKGKQSKSTLKKELNKNYSEISDAVDALLDKKLIRNLPTQKLKKKDRKPGKQELFYHLTFEGTKTIIDDPLTIPKNCKYNQLKSDEFWKILFENYSKKNKINQEQVVELCNIYEQNILSVNKKYFVPKFFTHWITDIQRYVTYSEIPRKDSPFEIKNEIISTIANENKITFDDLIKKVETKIGNKLPRWMDAKFDTECLIREGVIIKTGKNNSYLELSHLGLLNLIYLWYRDASIPLINEHVIDSEENQSLHGIEKSKNPNAKKFVILFHKIRKKYSYLLLEILGAKNYFNLGIDCYEVAFLLMKLYFKEPYFRLKDSEIEFNDEEDERYYSMQRFNQVRDAFYRRQLLEHLVAVEDEKIPDTENFAKIKFFLDTIWLLENERLGKNSEMLERFFNYKIYSKNIEDRITFDFYSVYRNYCDGWENGPLEHSRIRKWHDEYSKELVEFVSEYSVNISKDLELIQ